VVCLTGEVSGNAPDRASKLSLEPSFDPYPSTRSVEDDDEETIFWDVQIPYWREIHARVDDTGMPTTSSIVVEYLVEVREVRYTQNVDRDFEAEGLAKQERSHRLGPMALARLRKKQPAKVYKRGTRTVQVISQEYRSFTHFSNGEQRLHRQIPV
jgi:hypothetical protein